MSLSSKFTKSSSKQVIESYYSCNQGYTPWNLTSYQPHDLGYDAYQSNGFGDAYYGYEDPSPPYPPSQNGIEEVFQMLCQEMKETWEIQKQIDDQVNTVYSIVIHLMTQFAKRREDTLSQPRSNKWRSIPTLYTHQEGKEDAQLSKPLSNQWRSIPTLFLCVNQKEREDALLHEEDVESIEQEGMHECLEEVEEENEYQEAEDVDQEVEDKDKEQKGIKIVHFASFEATPPKLPFELHSSG
ncbi:hypothetical protein PIB30_051423 [Stylosanthes scabra]|uniref:Uncharacterized protein n=1 Tax=Stylosanthes scabra TaxID=79078 RepID=A0ABU6YGQ3_9FABA|nr:hypothetical protein [Stylosanthes scabra]